jgi:ABC-type glycerol-3-phosphate transport system permease component
VTSTTQREFFGHSASRPVNAADEEARPAALVRRRRRPVGKYVLNAVAVVFTLVWIFPIYWMLLTAVRPLGDSLTSHPSFLPWEGFSGVNFRTFLDDSFFWTAFRNSAVVVVLTVAIALFVGFLASIALGRHRFPGKRIAIVMVMIVQMTPMLAVLIPLYVIFSKVHMDDNLTGLIVAYLAVNLPFTIWTLRGFVAAIPVDLEEAAMVDGCSRFGAFRHVILPLVVPGLISTGIYVLIQTWNEFMMGNFLINSNSHWTLPLYLNNFFGSAFKVVPYGEVMALSLFMAAPVAVLFALVQGKVAAGMTAGAVKG